jgi:hypothetical protein
VRIGSISQGKTKCDNCGQTVAYADRYLIVREKKGVEDEEGEARQYCVACAREKGYAHSRSEKSERIVTFFPEMEKIIVPRAEAAAEVSESEDAAVPAENTEADADDEEEQA